MTSSVESLYEMFLSDPDIVATPTKSREEVAFGEAKQRFIQSMNNHKALSLAKSGPVEDLLSFLRYGQLLKSDSGTINEKNDGTRTQQEIQRREAGHSELIAHLRDEVMEMIRSGGRSEDIAGVEAGDFPHKWEDILEKPELLREALIPNEYELLSHATTGQNIADDYAPSDAEDEGEEADDAEEGEEGDEAQTPDDDVEEGDGGQIPEEDDGLRPSGKQRDLSDGISEGVYEEDAVPFKGQSDPSKRISFEDAQKGYSMAPSVDNQFGTRALETLKNRAQTPGAKDHIDSLKETIRLFNIQQAILKSNVHRIMGKDGNIEDSKSGKFMEKYPEGAEGSRTWWENKRNQTVHSIMQHIEELKPENEIFAQNEFSYVNDHDIRHEHEFSPKQAWHMSPAGSDNPKELREGVRRGFNVTPNGVVNHDLHTGNPEAVDKLIQQVAEEKGITLNPTVPPRLEEQELQHRYNYDRDKHTDTIVLPRPGMPDPSEMNIEDLGNYIKLWPDMTADDFREIIQPKLDRGDWDKENVMSLMRSITQDPLTNEDIQNIRREREKWTSNQDVIDAAEKKQGVLKEFMQDPDGNFTFNPDMTEDPKDREIRLEDEARPEALEQYQKRFGASEAANAAERRRQIGELEDPTKPHSALTNPRKAPALTRSQDDEGYHVGGTGLLRSQGVDLAIQKNSPGTYPGEENLRIHSDDLKHLYARNHPTLKNEAGRPKQVGYRNIMKAMVNLGVPLEDLTTRNAQGQPVWSLHSMEAGMKQWGFLNQSDTIMKGTGFNHTSGQPGTDDPRILPGSPDLQTGGKGHPAYDRRAALFANFDKNATQAQKDILAAHGDSQTKAPVPPHLTPEQKTELEKLRKNGFRPLTPEERIESGRQNLLRGLDGGHIRFYDHAQGQTSFFRGGVDGRQTGDWLEARGLDLPEGIGTTVQHLDTSAAVKEAASAVDANGDKKKPRGVDVSRKAGDGHYGNPWTHEGASLAEMTKEQLLNKDMILPTIQDANNAYEQWLRDGAEDKRRNREPTGKYAKVNPNQRKWIVDQIAKGELNHQALLLPSSRHADRYKDSETGAADPRESHADVLKRVVQDIAPKRPKESNIKYYFPNKKAGIKKGDLLPAEQAALLDLPPGRHPLGPGGMAPALTDPTKPFNEKTNPMKQIKDFDWTIPMDEWSDAQHVVYNTSIHNVPLGHKAVEASRLASLDKTVNFKKNPTRQFPVPQVEPRYLDLILNNAANEAEASGKRFVTDETLGTHHPITNAELPERVSSLIREGTPEQRREWYQEYRKKILNSPTLASNMNPEDLMGMKDPEIQQLYAEHAAINARAEALRAHPESRQHFMDDLKQKFIHAFDGMTDITHEEIAEWFKANGHVSEAPEPGDIMHPPKQAIPLRGGAAPSDDVVSPAEDAAPEGDIKVERATDRSAAVFTSPAVARENPDKLYLFGDNQRQHDPDGRFKVDADTGGRRQGTQQAGQAWIRHEDNAHGIRTKEEPNNNTGAHFSDNNLETNIRRIDEDLANAVKRAREEGKTLVIPANGLGTGRASLETQAPQTFAHLNKRLQEFENGDFSLSPVTTPAPGTTPTPEPVQPAAPESDIGGARVRNFGGGQQGIRDVRAAERNGQGVNILRKTGTNEHYGNPFTYKGGTAAEVELGSVQEATQAYDDWLHGRKYSNVRPEQRQWILDQIQSGALNNKNLLYYTDEHEEAGIDSHADVLQRFVNEAKGQPEGAAALAPESGQPASPAPTQEELDKVQQVVLGPGTWRAGSNPPTQAEYEQAGIPPGAIPEGAKKIWEDAGGPEAYAASRPSTEEDPYLGDHPINGRSVDELRQNVADIEKLLPSGSIPDSADEEEAFQGLDAAEVNKVAARLQHLHDTVKNHPEMSPDEQENLSRTVGQLLEPLKGHPTYDVNHPAHGEIANEERGEDDTPDEAPGDEPFNAAYSDQHGHIPADQKFEVSTQGNALGKQFSALNAKLPNGRTIEDVYQNDLKGGVGKGNVPEGMSTEDLHNAYTDLWKQWADANPEKLSELAEATRGKTLFDRFAHSQGTGVSQAHSLAEILNERHGDTTPPADSGDTLNTHIQTIKDAAIKFSDAVTEYGEFGGSEETIAAAHAELNAAKDAYKNFIKTVPTPRKDGTPRTWEGSDSDFESLFGKNILANLIPDSVKRDIAIPEYHKRNEAASTDDEGDVQGFMQQPTPTPPPDNIKIPGQPEQRTQGRTQGQGRGGFQGGGGVVNILGEEDDDENALPLPEGFQDPDKEESEWVDDAAEEDAGHHTSEGSQAEAALKGNMPPSDDVRSPLNSKAHPRELIQDLLARNKAISSKTENLQKLLHTPPNDPSWYGDGNTKPHGGEPQFRKHDDQDSGWTKMPGPDGKMHWRQIGRSKNDLQDPTKDHDEETNPYGMMVTPEQANQRVRSNAREKQFKAVAGDLQREINAAKKTHELLRSQVGDVMGEPVSPEDYQKFLQDWAKSGRALGFFLGDDDPPMNLTGLDKSYEDVFNNGNITSGLKNEFMDSLQFDLVDNETGEITKSDNHPGRIRHTHPETGEEIEDTDDHYTTDGIDERTEGADPETSKEKEAAHTSPDVVRPAGDEADWGVDEKYDYIQSIVDSLKPRMKNETAKNYLQGLADTAIRNRTQHLEKRDENKSLGEYKNGSWNDPNNNNPTVLDSLTAIEKKIAGHDLTDITLGELIHLGNTHSIGLGGVGLDNFEKGTLDTFHREGFGKTAAGLTPTHSPERLMPDADDDDKAALEEAHKFTYHTKGFLQNHHGTEEGAKLYKEHRDKMRAASVGRFGPNGEYISDTGTPPEKTAHGFRETHPKADYTMDTITAAEETLKNWQPDVYTEQWLKRAHQLDPSGNMVMNEAKKAHVASVAGEKNAELKEMTSTPPPPFEEGVTDPTSYMRDILIHQKAVNRNNKSMDTKVKHLWANAFKQAYDAGGDLDRLQKEEEQFPGEHFGSGKHMEEVGKQDIRNRAQHEEFQGILNNPDKIKEAWNDPHYHPHKSEKINPETGEHENTRYVRTDDKGRAFESHAIEAPGDDPMHIDRHNGYPDAANQPKAPDVLGLTRNQKEEYNQLHKDIQQHKIDNGNDAPLPTELGRRKQMFHDSLSSEHKTDDVVDSPVNHPHFGATHDDIKRVGGSAGEEWKNHLQEKKRLTNVHNQLNETLNTLTPGSAEHEKISDDVAAAKSNLDNHSLSWDSRANGGMPSPEHLQGHGGGEGMHKHEGIGLIHEDRLAAIRKELKPGEAFLHHGGENATPLVHNDDGVTPKRGVKLLVSHDGVQVVKHHDGQALHSNMNGITPEAIRQHDLGKHIDGALKAKSPAIEHFKDGIKFDKAAVLPKDHPLNTHAVGRTQQGERSNIAGRSPIAAAVRGAGPAMGKIGKIGSKINTALGTSYQESATGQKPSQPVKLTDLMSGNKQPQQEFSPPTSVNKLSSWVANNSTP